MMSRQVPPTRRSTVIGSSGGRNWGLKYHFARSSGRVHASNTSDRVAATGRVRVKLRVSSRPIWTDSFHELDQLVESSLIELCVLPQPRVHASQSNALESAVSLLPSSCLAHQ